MSTGNLFGGGTGETIEEELQRQKDEEEHRRLWDEAEPEPEVIEEGDPGHQMRSIDEMSSMELGQLRLSAIFGIVGTFIWAFGDLLGGFPKHS